MSHDARVPGPDEQGPVLSSVLRSSLRCPLSGQELADGVDDTGHPVLISQPWVWPTRCATASRSSWSTRPCALPRTSDPRYRACWTQPVQVLPREVQDGAAQWRRASRPTS